MRFLVLYVLKLDKIAFKMKDLQLNLLTQLTYC